MASTEVGGVISGIGELLVGVLLGAVSGGVVESTGVFWVQVLVGMVVGRVR